MDRRPKYAQELMISKVAIDPTQAAGSQFRTQFMTDNQRAQQEDPSQQKLFMVVPMKSQQTREDLIRQQEYN